LNFKADLEVKAQDEGGDGDDDAGVDVDEAAPVGILIEEGGSGASFSGGGRRRKPPLSLSKAAAVAAVVVVAATATTAADYWAWIAQKGGSCGCQIGPKSICST